VAKSFGRLSRATALVLLASATLGYPTSAMSAEANYVLVTKSPVCSVIISGVSVEHFKLLLRKEDLPAKLISR
jgi:hypothetical protein